MPDDLVEDDVVKMFPIWDINRNAVEVFLALATQWRVVVAGGGMVAARMIWLGLDYSAVDVVIRRFGYDQPGIFDDVRVMETAALAVFDGAEA